MKQRRPITSTAEQLCVTLPLPPSINEQYYTDTKGNRRLTPVALRYKAVVQRVLHNLKQQGVLNAPLVKRMSTSYLALYFECYFPTPLQRDLDGGLKIMLDAICRGLGANDNRVVEIPSPSAFAPRIRTSTLKSTRWTNGSSTKNTGSSQGDQEARHCPEKVICGLIGNPENRECAESISLLYHVASPRQ